MRLLLSTLISLAVCGCADAREVVRSMPFTFDATADSVRLTGRWVTDQTLDVPMLAKANTAEILCVKKSMSCIEAIAVLITPEDNPRAPGELLFSVLSQYTVESWTDSVVVAKSEKKVADVTLRIDLLAKGASRRHQETKARGNESADPSYIIDWRLQ